MSIIAGDFNFSQNKSYSDYVDIWKTGKIYKTKRQQDTDQKGSEISSFTMPKTNKYDSWRPDHIIFKKSSAF